MKLFLVISAFLMLLLATFVSAVPTTKDSSTRKLILNDGSAGYDEPLKINRPLARQETIAEAYGGNARGGSGGDGSNGY